MKHFNIALLPGDGIGPEIIAEGIKAVTAAAQVEGIAIDYTPYPYGADYYLKTGQIMPDTAIRELADHDAIYFGAVGDPRIAPGILEQELLLKLRFDLDLYVNLRPCKRLPHVLSPLKSDENIDILIIRENTEDFYINTGITGTGRTGRLQTSIKRHNYSCDIDASFDMSPPQNYACNLGLISALGAQRISRFAFNLAKKESRKKIHCISKRNAVPQMYSVWENAFYAEKALSEGVQAEVMNVDNAAMQLIKAPGKFDMILAPNLFGDILSDLTAELCGGLGFGASGNINPGRVSMFEPIHGSAPKYKGMNTANPTATILAGALMLKYLGEDSSAARIEKAVWLSMESGDISTRDMGGSTGTDRAGEIIAGNILGSKHKRL